MRRKGSVDGVANDGLVDSNKIICIFLFVYFNMLELRLRRQRRQQANQMNAAPFVFCGILFVTRFYHFTCGEALNTVCLCVCICE